MDIIFEKSGGVTLLSNNYVHHYNDPVDAANDFGTFLETRSIEDMAPSEIVIGEVEVGDGVKHHMHDAMDIIADGGIRSCRHNICLFYETLGCEKI